MKRPDGSIQLRANCKDCAWIKAKARIKANYDIHKIRHRYSVIKNKYGISKEEVDGLLKRQNNQCAICFDPVTIYSHIDHCHKSTQVRGILCPGCNSGLGYFKDNTESLQQAILYLESGESN